jgi:hypothetical protein
MWALEQLVILRVSQQLALGIFLFLEHEAIAGGSTQRPSIFAMSIMNESRSC